MQSNYFQQLTQDLKQQGTGTPQLILDLAQYRHNLEVMQSKLPAKLKPRLVVKSLASIQLLKLASEKLNTQRFMVFHLPHLLEIIGTFQQADILLGKPMPIQAVKHFYQTLSDQNKANDQVIIQWLIDDVERLKQYLQLAQSLNTCLNVNIEIDVGLHRGGVQTQQQFIALMELIQDNAAYIKFSGLMGYDAHVAKLPKILKSPEKSYQQSQHLINTTKPFFSSNSRIYGMRVCALTEVEVRPLCSIASRANAMIWLLVPCWSSRVILIWKIYPL